MFINKMQFLKIMFVLSVRQYADATSMSNVALGKKVTLSSLHSGGAAEHAVDGSQGGEWSDGCACTNKQENPWMLIDLEANYLISDVYIVNRQDCCPGRLSHLHIEIGEFQENLTEVWYHQNAVEEDVTFSFGTVYFGRFVKIWLEKIEYLTICEVEIYCSDIHSNWTDWNEWSACTQSCGNGTAYRTRSCLDSHCCGETNETQLCNTNSCPDSLDKQREGPCSYKPRDCQDIGTKWSGVYHVTPVGTHSGFDVFCDMETDKGGWTVIQSREDSSVDFNRNWTDYLCGFGEVLGSHWLGLLRIKTILSQGEYELRIDLEDWEGNRRHAKYDIFNVGDPLTHYDLHLDGYSGDANDAMSKHVGLPFSTPDRDLTDKKCASLHAGGWWFSDCYDSHLNGQYMATNQSGIHWNLWHGDQYSLKTSEMKIRRN